MANKRISELASITSTGLATDDLFLLADVSAVESKKLPVLQLTNYLQANITSSLTSSYALTSKSASYLNYNGYNNGTASFTITSSYNISSSHANLTDTSSHALYSISASYAKTASYVVSASYAVTSSVYVMTSVTYANSASYLIYTGGPNGTASYAVNANSSLTSNTASYLSGGTASYALYTPLAKTASHLQYTGTANGTASYALRSNLSILADGTKTSSYLYYDGIANGTASNARTASYAFTSSYVITASYAMSSPGIYRTYGPFTPSITGGNTGSISLNITSSNTYPRVVCEVYGDHGIPFRHAPTTNGHIHVQAFQADLASYVNVAYTWAHAKAGSPDWSGSVTQSFYMKKGNVVLAAPFRWDFTIWARECNFQSGYNPLTMWIHSREVDDINTA